MVELDYQGNKERFGKALDKIGTYLSSCEDAKGTKGSGQQIDVRTVSEANVEFVPTINDSGSDSSEYFQASQPTSLKELVSLGAIEFKSAHCAIYDSGDGKGERDFGLWLQYYISPKVMEDIDFNGLP